MLAAAVGPNLTKLLHDQLDLMFAFGLSEPLRQALMSIAKHIPPLLKTVQGALVVAATVPSHGAGIDGETLAERLLDLISVILSGQSYRPLGAPNPIRPEHTIR